MIQRALLLLCVLAGGLLCTAAVHRQQLFPRIAVLWVVPGVDNWPHLFDLVAYTLMVHDTKCTLHLHILTPSVPETYTTGEKSRWPFLQNVYFHIVNNDDWHQRIHDRLGLNISYTLVNKKKVADFKPMLGYIFPDIVSKDKYDYWVYGDYDGYFGAYDAILNYQKLLLYEVVTGYVSKSHPLDSVDFSGTSHYALGSWTMLKNTDKINTLFKRSKTYEKVITNDKRQYSFDENTDSSPLRENIHDVIKKSEDVSRCCYNDDHQPTVRNDKDYKLVIDMKGDYVRDGVKVKFRWEKNKAVVFSLDGKIGMKSLYRNHTSHGLFLHFLQWKFVRPRLFNDANKKFVADILTREGGYASLDCFEVTLNTENVGTTELLYVYKFCSPT